jgi:hypothetical protein
MAKLLKQVNDSLKRQRRPHAFNQLNGWGRLCPEPGGSSSKGLQKLCQVETLGRFVFDAPN